MISRKGEGNVDKGSVNNEVAIKPRKIPPMMATNLSAGIPIKLFRSFLMGRIVNMGVNINPVRKPNNAKTVV